MTIILNTTLTNRADWKTQFQFNDADTGDLLDFTGASIEVDVKDSDGCQRIQASITNGKITIVSLGIFELDVSVTEMQNLCPGAYKIGGLYLLNGETISLFTGTLSIIDGVARI